MLMGTLVSPPSVPTSTFAVAHGSAGGETKLTDTVVVTGGGSIELHAPIPMSVVAPASLKNCRRDGPPTAPQPSSSTARTAAGSLQTDVRMKMLVLHAPESLGLKQEYIKEHEGLGH